MLHTAGETLVSRSQAERVEGALVKELLGKQQDVQVVGFLWGTVLLKLKIQRQNANPHR